MELEGGLALAALIVSIGSAISQVVMWQRERATRLSIKIVPYTSGLDTEARLEGILIDVMNLSRHPVPLAGVSLKDHEMDDVAHLLALPLEGRPVVVDPLDGWHRFLSADELKRRLIDLPEGRVTASATTVAGEEFSSSVDVRDSLIGK